jgi:hypothetical protein
VSRFPQLCIFFALVTLGLPVALVPMPPLVDYPNHFARLWLLMGGVRLPPVSAMYGIDWTGASTNIGIDLLAVTVGRPLGIDLLGPLLVVAAAMLPPAGAVLFNRVLFGRFHWWQAGFAIFAWNTTLLGGFLTFQIGLGLALLAACLDQAVIRRMPLAVALVLRVVICAMLLVFHLFAGAFYAALVAGLVFGPNAAPFRTRKLFLVTAGRSLAAGCFIVGLPALLFLLLAPAVPGANAPPGVFDIWAHNSVVNKIGTLLTCILTYDLAVDSGFFLAAALLAAFAARMGAFRLHAGLALTALGLLLLAVLVPRECAGTAFVDWRFPIMALLTGISAMQPQVRTVRGANLAAGFLAALAVMRTGWIADIWHQRDADVASVQRALREVPAGAAILPVENIPDETRPMPTGRYLLEGFPTYWHDVAYAVPLRHAFVPTLFTARGKQPLIVRPPWDRIAVETGIPVPVNFLTHYEPKPKVVYLIGYAANWRETFDYALLLNADLAPARTQAALPPGLELVADEGFARLYRIRHGATAGVTR